MCGLLTALSPKPREAERSLRAWTNRALKPLKKWASAYAEPREPVSVHLNPRKGVSILPHDSPGVILNPVLCRGCFHARRESQFHRPAKRLLGTGNPNPGKRPPPAAFFNTPNGAAARPAGRCEHTFSQPVKSLVFSARKGA